MPLVIISTHAPAGGATGYLYDTAAYDSLFLLTPLREGRPDGQRGQARLSADFYSRPCGRGDRRGFRIASAQFRFLLTPLREGRPCPLRHRCSRFPISTHAPAGGATVYLVIDFRTTRSISTHAPAGGATLLQLQRQNVSVHFYSRPCGRGDVPASGTISVHVPLFLLTPLREGRLSCLLDIPVEFIISTHAPAGGATAIFHKSVMRFCGKLPKDDTVLCLASFGFPRRDPKAVYLAWISCANLPQKCVRQGLALKDQGTSCFHEGLASHAFDPVLV